MITTVQCSICSQLTNKPRVVVTDFRLHHTCSIWLHSLSGGYLKLTLQPNAFSLGIIIKCNWWHSRQANDVVASEPSIFSENYGYESSFHVAVNMYVPIFRCLDARGGRKLQTDTHTHTHTHETTTVTFAARMRAEG